MKLTFFGAAREVTGSCTLVETGKSRILVDCGMFQGHSEASAKNKAEFGFDPASIDALVVTHAHIDHIGRIPLLVSRGFKGTIYATKPTRMLMKIMWRDAAQVLKTEARRFKTTPLYKSADTLKAWALVIGVGYGLETKITPDISAIFHDAGHIFGSSFIELKSENKKLIFSGDLGTMGVPILRDPEHLTNANAVVLESTYGDRNRPSAAERKPELIAAIKDLVNKKGVMVIPAFSLERTQEILYELDDIFADAKIPKVSVFLDSPLALKAMPIYKMFSELYDVEASAKKRAGLDFFDFKNLTIVNDDETQDELIDTKPPKIIIAGSGMIHGGKVMKHIANHVSGQNNMVLIVGYQAQNTLGRALLDGKPMIHIEGRDVPVHAEIRQALAYSAHADMQQLLNWVKNAAQPKTIILNHGDVESADNLAKLLRNEVQSQIVTPAFGESVEV